MSQSFNCHCCELRFQTAGEWATHLRLKNITHNIPNDTRTELVAAGCVTCRHCGHWYTRKGISRHKCTIITDDEDSAAVDDSDSETDDAEQFYDAIDGNEDGVLRILSQENRRFLQNLNYQELLVCPYQTLAPPPQETELMASCYGTVDALHKNKEVGLALKLHFLMVRLVSYPSITDEERGMSHRTLFKARVRAFKQGNWSDLWDLQKQVRVGVHASPQEARPEDHLTLSRKAKKRSRDLAEQLELAKARRALMDQKLADPTDPEVFQTLQELHQPQTPLKPFPELPQHYRTHDMYAFEVTTVKVPGPRDKVDELPSDQVVLQKLKKKVAQASSGTRYEHYMGLETAYPELIRDWITMIANDRMPDVESEDAIRAAKLFAFYKDKANNKKKLRPCAIGETLRRITAKVMVLQDNPSLQEKFLRVRQLGVGTKGGMEVAYHSTRLHLDALIDQEKDVQNDSKGIKGLLQADFTNAFNSTCRSQMFKSIAENAPQLLRFYVLCYSDERGTEMNGDREPPLLVIWAGKLQNIIKSSFGTQQGDVCSTMYFGFATLEFAEMLMEEVPEAWIAWYVDDLVVSASLEDMAAVATLIKEHGPRYGLFLSPKPQLRQRQVRFQDDVMDESDNVPPPAPLSVSKVKNWIYLPPMYEGETPEQRESVYNKVVHGEGPNNPAMEVLADLQDFALTTDGLQRLLGAPLGTSMSASAHAVEIVQDLLKGLENLHHIGHAQLEFYILKHCDATKATHLTRMLTPRTAQNALNTFEAKIRAELDRIHGGPKMPDRAWEQAKQPVRTIGMGLQDVTLTAGANYAAALGDVARMMDALKEKHTPEEHMEPVLMVAAQIRKDQELAQIVDELRESTEDATTEKICPTVDQIEHFPTQKQMSRAVYKDKAEQLIRQSDAAFGGDDTQMKLRYKNWLVSQSQLGAGAQFKALPGPKKYKIEATTFQIMIQQFLMIEIPNIPRKCLCGANMDKYAMHWIDCPQCPTGSGAAQQSSWLYGRHNKLRDAHIKLTKDYLCLTLSVKSNGSIPGQPDQMPGDSIASARFYDTPKDLYFDYTVVNPAGPANSRNNPNAEPLKTANTAEVNKIKKHHAKLWQSRIEPEDAPFEKVPLGFEVTGAMGKRTKQHVKQMLKKYQERFPAGITIPSLKQQGDQDHTWTANSFLPMLYQTLTVTITEQIAQMVKIRRRDAISVRASELLRR